MMKKSFVAIEHAPPHSIEESVRKCLDLIGWKNSIKKGAKVGIKVNLGWDRFVPGCTTSPRVVKGLVSKLKEITDDITIVENNSIAHDSTKAFDLFRYTKLAEQMGIKLFNLVTDNYKSFDVDLGKDIGKVKIEIAKSLFDFDVFITVPVIKTHGLTTYTGSIKNQWGCIRKSRFLLHSNVSKLLAELNSIIPPTFVVADGTIIMDGQAPKLGNPRRLDLVLASTDFVALDTVSSYIFGLNPKEILHIQACGGKHLGISELENIETNMNLDELQFKCSPAGGLSYGDFPRMISNFILHHKTLKYIAFHTSLFELLRRMYARYNDLWYFFVGIKKRKEILKNYDYFGDIK